MLGSIFNLLRHQVINVTVKDYTVLAPVAWLIKWQMGSLM